jgi:hypothetical protein
MVFTLSGAFQIEITRKPGLRTTGRTVAVNHSLAAD